ncbi:MAG: hypothetical protein ABJA66_10690 [Actinomycetota bacterium]
MFVDKAFGDDFINVSLRVGKTGAFDDVLAVQMMLKFIFENSPLLKKVNPVKGPILVNGQASPQLPMLIATFQKHIMHRPKPEGFINKAVGTDDQKGRTTIWRLNTRCEFILAVLRSPLKNIFELMAQMSPFAPKKVQTQP